MESSVTQADLQRLVPIARELLESDCSCHDWDHTQRVLRMALLLGRSEGANLQVVEAAAILHDIARPQEMADKGHSDHAQLGAAMAEEILKREGVGDDSFRQQVCHCIRTHRFRRRQDESPATIEARVLYDADKLDSLGAIGVARSLHFAGQAGARVHNRAEEALSSDSYSRQDSAYREFLVKQSKVPQRMLTAAGSKLAYQRVAFMEEFFQRLDQECYGDDPMGTAQD